MHPLLRTCALSTGVSVALDLDLTTSASGVTVARASSGLAQAKDGTWVSFVADTARRTDAGLLVEKESTNAIRNPSMGGAVVGTPGTKPTNWRDPGSSSNGLALSIAAAGHMVLGSLPGLRVRAVGTTTATSSVLMTPDQLTQIAAAQGQDWTASWVLSLDAGTLTNITSARITLVERDAAGAQLAQSSKDIQLSATPTRYTLTRTLTNAGTAYVTTAVQLLHASGVAVDATVGAAAPQLERGLFATSPILTTTGPATRAADVVTLTDSSVVRFAVGAVHAEWTDGHGPVATDGVIWSARVDATNAMTVLRNTDNKIEARAVVGGNVSASLVSMAAISEGNAYRSSLSYRSGTYNLALTSSLQPTALTATGLPLPGPVTSVTLGSDGSGAFLNGTLTRLRVYHGTPSSARMLSAVNDNTPIYPYEMGAVANDMAGDYTTQLAAAFATGRPVYFDGWYRITQQLVIPGGARIVTADPENAGIVSDSAATVFGVVFGDYSAVNGLGVKSYTYPMSLLANSTNYSLAVRGVSSGSHCSFSDVYMSDLCCGLDIDGKTDVSIKNLHGTNIRSRLGQAAVVHVHQGSYVTSDGVYGTDCDRFCEVEASSHHVAHANLIATNIFPAGYVGQPVDFATYSFNFDLGHDHENEGACHHNSYTNATAINCLSSLTASRSSGSVPTDLPYAMTATNVTIINPRMVNSRYPVELQGYDITVDGLTFGGDAYTAALQLIKTTASELSDNIVVKNVTIPDQLYSYQIAALMAAGSELRNVTVGRRNPAITTAFTAFRSAANDVVFDAIDIDQPTYGSAIWTFDAGMTGNQRTNCTSTLAPANAVAAAVALNGNTVTQSGNQDLIAA